MEEGLSTVIVHTIKYCNAPFSKKKSNVLLEDFDSCLKATAVEGISLVSFYSDLRPLF